MTDIRIKPHSETFVDTNTVPVSPSKKGKISDVDLEDYFRAIGKDDSKIEVDNMSPLMALSLLDFLVNKLVNNHETEIVDEDSNYNEIEDPLINDLVKRDLKGNFEGIPWSRKKRLREVSPETPETPNIENSDTNIIVGSSKSISTPPSTRSSSADSNELPSSSSASPNPQSDLLTKRFALKVPPALSSTQYLDRINQYCDFSTAVYLAAAYYIHELVVEQHLLKLTRLNVHRLIIAALRIGCKVAEDINHRQAFIAKIGGVNPKDLLDLEISFLFLIKFECQVDNQIMTGLVEKLRDIHNSEQGK